MKLLFGFIFILCFSCTSLSRKVASDSDFPRFIFHKECPNSFDFVGECYKLSTRVKFLTRNDKSDDFHFPLPKLQSPFYEPIPYYVSMAKSDAECDYSDSVVMVKEGTFRIKAKSESEHLVCRSKDNKAELEFSYILPILSAFPVREAEWMRGFFPDVINQTELKLAQIYNKWTQAKLNLGLGFKIEDGITYRGRELLLKYFNDTSYEVINPRQFGFQFEKTLATGDLLVIRDVAGYLFHRKLGSTDHGGFETESYLEQGRAGERYLEKTKIKPFEFFCTQNEKIYDFRQKNEVIFNKPGTVKCSINSKKNFFFPLIKPKGQTEFYAQFMNVEKSMARVPSQIENASVKIQNEIKKMNDTNRRVFRSWIYREVAKKESAVESQLYLDSKFEPVIDIDGKKVSRGKLEICGVLKRSSAPRDYRAFVDITIARAYYGLKFRDISLPNPQSLRTQIKYTDNTYQCFPIDAESLIKERYLPAVLFYEP